MMASDELEKIREVVVVAYLRLSKCLPLRTVVIHINPGKNGCPLGGHSVLE
jgi:hypothetical protein